MTMDRTLKLHGGLLRARSVLSRTERIAQMIEEGKFDPQKDSPMGLPKMKVKHSRAGSKSKKAAEETPAEGAAPAAAPAAGAAAPAAKGAKGEKPKAEKPKAKAKGKEKG